MSRVSRFKCCCEKRPLTDSRLVWPAGCLLGTPVLALCANDNRLQIYEGCNNPSFASWRLAHVLEEHDLVISGISWSPVTNKIVTCSHDRNAFVWSYDASQVGSGLEGPRN